jgi:hypothetical protein
VDVANAQVAIKKVVFEDKAATMPELLKEALKANWEGYDDIYRLCMQSALNTAMMMTSVDEYSTGIVVRPTILYASKQRRTAPAGNRAGLPHRTLLSGRGGWTPSQTAGKPILPLYDAPLSPGREPMLTG